MPDEPEEGFTVRDRRRFLSDDAPDQPASAPTTPPPARPAPPTPPPPPQQRPVASPAAAAPRPQAPGGFGGFSGGANPGNPGAGFPGGGFGTPGAAFGGTADQDFDPEAFGDEVYGDELDAADPDADADYPSREIPDVYSMLLVFLEQFRGLALIYMGLIASPATGQAVRDLGQAKVAIDAVAFIVSQLEPVIAPEERLPLKALVSDLQINFVELSKRGG